ncbi:MAG: BMP family ABC transporter substrate-binding protein [Synergistetes bacterium]|nr:BMP family ABC transporter substrate-binding protein [Synergistota bacterium]
MKKLWLVSLLVFALSFGSFGVSVLAAQEKLKVGFVYVGPVGDAGWTYAHDQGRKYLEKQFPNVETVYLESVPEGAEAARAIEHLVAMGCKVIFTTSYGFMDPTIEVAKKYPNVVFMHCSGFKMAPNVGIYFGKIEEARFLSGIVAGRMTKSNKLGYVAAHPIPEVIRGINAFTLGARKVNPKVTVHVVWTNTWYDPATEKEAALSLIEAGCDVIAQHQDSPAPQQAAQEKGVYSIGYNSDMSAFAPKAHLTAPVWNWGVIYAYVIKNVLEGKWKSEDIWWGMDKGVVGLAPFGPMVPEDVRNEVLKYKELIVSGKFNPFTGPIVDQDGKVRIPDGKVATDSELREMNYFVEGVIGKIPKK